MTFEEPDRSLLRVGIARIGLAKATIVAPAIEHCRQWQTWLECAGELSLVLLQQKVSEALDALPRGRELSPPGERFRRMVLAALPDIDWSWSSASSSWASASWARRMPSRSSWPGAASACPSGSSRRPEPSRVSTESTGRDFARTGRVTPSDGSVSNRCLPAGAKSCR
jgi:hypothetical protein